MKDKQVFGPPKLEEKEAVKEAIEELHNMLYAKSLHPTMAIATCIGAAGMIFEHLEFTQVKHLVNTVAVLRDQLDAYEDFIRKTAVKHMLVASPETEEALREFGTAKCPCGCGSDLTTDSSGEVGRDAFN